MIPKNPWRSAIVTAALLMNTVLAGLAATAADPNLERVPHGGIQPQTAVGSDGTLHLIYFKGEPAAGDIYYVTRRKGEFSQPIRVNSSASAAMAIGSVRGATLALGKNDRPHVAWMGSAKVPAKLRRQPNEAPMLYTRLNEAGAGFAPETNVMSWTAGLDGGGAVAADPLGNVYAAWHGIDPKLPHNEASRQMFLARSTDGGETFSREEAINPLDTGACGCCGMAAFADEKGGLHILYRAAQANVHRDMIFLSSPNGKKPFHMKRLDEWTATTCPMSTASLTGSSRLVLGAWEHQDQARLGTFQFPGMHEYARVSPPLNGKQKHPSLARNSKGEFLLAWVEGAGWAKGGPLRWALYSAEGELLDQGEGEDVPVWSFPSVVAADDGPFTIYY